MNPIKFGQLIQAYLVIKDFRHFA